MIDKNDMINGNPAAYWNMVGIIKEDTDANLKTDININLLIAITTMSRNGEPVESRVIAVVAKLLDEYRSGEISMENLIAETNETKLFSKQELDIADMLCKSNLPK
jgi:hypothetical protein